MCRRPAAQVSNKKKTLRCDLIKGYGPAGVDDLVEAVKAMHALTVLRECQRATANNPVAVALVFGVEPSKNPVVPLLKKAISVELHGHPSPWCGMGLTKRLWLTSVMNCHASLAGPRVVGCQFIHVLR